MTNPTGGWPYGPPSVSSVFLITGTPKLEQGFRGTSSNILETQKPLRPRWSHPVAELWKRSGGAIESPIFRTSRPTEDLRYGPHGSLRSTKFPDHNEYTIFWISCFVTVQAVKLGRNEDSHVEMVTARAEKLGRNEDSWNRRSFDPGSKFGP